MPSTIVEVRCDYPPEQETRIVEIAHAALVKSFKIPEGDRCVRLITYAPHLFICPPKYEHPERYTVVTISAFSGRSMEAKRNLYLSLVEGLEEVGIPRTHVKIILNEVPTENWGLGGGKPASEIELGFKIEV